MANPSVLVGVPATVGNFGGALDCAALALDAPLNVKVTPRLDGHAGALEAPLPPTCEKNVAGLEEALQVRMPGILAVFVCGSGPAVGILAQDNACPAISAVQDCFGRHGVGSSVGMYRPTNAGARDWNAVRPDVALPRRTSSGRGASPLKSPVVPV
jgi:homoserine kinase